MSGRRLLTVGGLIGAGLLLALVVVWVGLLDYRATLVKNPPVARWAGSGVAVKVAAAQAEDVTDVIGAASSVEALSMVQLRALVRARIEEISVDLGDRVRSGQVLARLSQAELQATVGAARQGVDRARAELERIERTSTTLREVLVAAEVAARDGVSKAESDLEKAIRSEPTLRAEYRATLAATRDSATRARVERDHQEATVARLRVLFERQVIARAELEAAETRLSAARAAETASLLELTRAENDVANADVTIRAMLDTARTARTAARERLARAQNDLQNHSVTQRAEIETARHQLATALEQLAEAERALAHATIVSPVDGIVLERRKQVGETPEPQEEVVSLGTVDSIYVVARIAEEHVARVRPRDRAEVVFDAFPNETFTGAVVKIDPTTDIKTRTFRAFVRVENMDRRFRPGLSAYTRLEWKRRALIIPGLAVVKNADEAAVFVVEEGRARLRRVQVLPVAGARMEVVSGLRPGERVIYYPVAKLKESDEVVVTDEAARGELPIGNGGRR